MSQENFARTPEPPYFAVIFSSQRQGDDPNYAKVADQMVALAAVQPGYLGVESVRDQNGFGITVSYWASEDAIKAWKQQAEHAEARRLGRTQWYEHFELRVAKVERAYCGPRGER